MSQQINLLNPALKQQQSQPSFRVTAMVWAAVAAIAIVFAAYVRLDAASLAALEGENSARIAAARAETQKLSDQVSSRQRDPRVAAEVVELQAQVRDRQEVMAVLQTGTVGDTKGFSEHLRAFARQSFEGMWLTGLRIAGSGQDVAVEGRALKAEHVPGYLKRLNGERVMQGHPFSELVIELPKAQPGEKAAGSAGFVEFRLATVPVGTATASGGRQ